MRNGWVRDAVLFDIQRRFNIDVERMYFASSNNTAAIAAASAYPDLSAGVILVSVEVRNIVLPTSMPVGLVVGKRDSSWYVIDLMHKSLKKTGRPCELVLHQGGKEWPAQQQVESVQWLTRQAR